MSGRVLAGVVMLLLVLLPALSIAIDDLSASRHETGMRQQPVRGWRTLPSAIERPAHVPRATLLQAVEVAEPESLLPLLSRTPFVPPRG